MMHIIILFLLSLFFSPLNSEIKASVNIRPKENARPEEKKVVPYQKKSITLRTVEKEINVNGKKAKVLALTQTNGTIGLTMQKGDQFDVIIENTLKVPTSIHWHGILLPNSQDGVAFITQYPIYPGTQYLYQFPLHQSGTYFMHAHYGLQEQLLLAAPLIIHNAEDTQISDQEIVVMLSDFSFKSPSEIYRELTCNKNPMEMHSKKPDVVDVNYDAFLANFRTADSPDVFQVKAEKRIRLRFINAASSTNFILDLGDLEGEAIAVDGNRIEPVRGSTFELGVAQRIDILVKIPRDGGAFPIFAKGEGTQKQTGIVLYTQESRIPKLQATAPQKTAILTNQQEASFHSLNKLPLRSINQKVLVELGGNMANYTWTLNGQAWPESTPIVVKKGDRVEMTFKNTTMMSHPMHLHGHVFQVTAIDDKPISGALRDTILVPPQSSITVQFDANNPGVWPLHCHLLYHLEAGMFTVVRYSDFVQPL